MALTAILALLPAAWAELLPSARRVDWTANVAVGVPGGIPHRTQIRDVTQAPYNADNTGARDAAAAIQAAVRAASSGDVVFLPAGIYRLDTIVYIPHDKDGITVRGAGMEATVLDVRTNTAFSVGSGSDYSWSWPSSGNQISSGLSKGSSVISIASTLPFKVGQIIKIEFENLVDEALIKAGYVPTVSVMGFPHSRSQKTRITSISGSTLSIYPALYYAPPAGLSAEVKAAQQQADFVGVEDLCIDGAKGAMIFPIVYDQCYGCWIKGVKVVNTNNYGLFLTDSLQCEVRECVVKDRKTGGSNGAGILMGGVSASLIEDNIVLNIAPGIEVNSSSTGNVIAYNAMENTFGGTINTNHAPHNSFNLYEGNVTPNLQCDGYFGGASDDTVFRNWIHGTNLQRSIRVPRVSLNRFTRNYTLIGNIIGETGMTVGGPYSFGNPNMGNGMYDGSAKAASGQFWKDWGAKATILNRTSDTAGSIRLSNGSFFVGQLGCLVWPGGRLQFSASSAQSQVIGFANATGTALPPLGTEVSVYMGPSGYQELDLDVEATTIRKGNYNYLDRRIPADETLNNETLPGSLFRSSKPAYFGNLPWPAFDPLNPNPSFESIPAGYRYARGESVPGIVVESLPQAPSSLRVDGQ